MGLQYSLLVAPDSAAEVIKMLNYVYDAEAEKRVLLQEGRQEGRQEGIDLLARLLKEGLSVDDAVATAKKAATESGTA